MAKKKPTRQTVRKAPKKSRTTTPPFPQYPAWSTSKFWSFVRSGLRSTYNKWPPKWEALKAAKRDYQGPNKRQKHEYLCNACSGWFAQANVSVDHIEPAGALNSFDDLVSFVQKLFVGVEGLQVLCDACHHKKTQEERKSKGDSA